MSGKQIGLRFSREIACLHEMAETEAEFNYIILWDYRFQFLITGRCVWCKICCVLSSSL